MAKGGRHILVDFVSVVINFYCVLAAGCEATPTHECIKRDVNSKQYNCVRDAGKLNKIVDSIVRRCSVCACAYHTEQTNVYWATDDNMPGDI